MGHQIRDTNINRLRVDERIICTITGAILKPQNHFTGLHKMRFTCFVFNQKVRIAFFEPDCHPKFHTLCVDSIGSNGPPTTRTKLFLILAPQFLRPKFTSYKSDIYQT